MPTLSEWFDFLDEPRCDKELLEHATFDKHIGALKIVWHSSEWGRKTSDEGISMSLVDKFTKSSYHTFETVIDLVQEIEDPLTFKTLITLIDKTMSTPLSEAQKDLVKDAYLPCTAAPLDYKVETRWDAWGSERPLFSGLTPVLDARGNVRDGFWEADLSL